MKTNFSLKFKAAKVVIALAAVLPILGFAASAHADTSAAVNASAVSAFCANVDASTTTLDTLISDKEASYESGKAASDKALEASRAASDKQLYDARVAANADYATQFKALAASATTDDQKAAVAAFKKTVLQAVATRRANVDVAIKNYRDGVDAILAAHSTTYLSALSTLKSSVDKNLGGGNCSTAQSAFQAAITDITNDTDALSALASTRDTKVAAADTKFSGIITTAAATLNAALGTQ